VDKDIKGAFGFHKLINRCALGEVAAMGRNCEAVLAWLDRSVIDACYGGTIARERKGNRTANTMGCTGDERAFAFKVDEHEGVPLLGFCKLG
jgi:hypothetical protein